MVETEPSPGIHLVRKTLQIPARTGESQLYAKWVGDDGDVSAWVADPKDADRLSIERSAKVLEWYETHEYTGKLEVIDAPEVVDLE